MYDRVYQSKPSSAVQKQNTEKAERKGMYLPSQSFDPFRSENSPQSNIAPAQMMEDDQKKKKEPQAKMDSGQMKGEKKKQVQKKAAQRNPVNSFGADFSIKGAITAMPGAVQQKMENSFGADFSNVAIHKDSGSATDMGALAYAQGNEIHFAPGQYNPETRKGQELLGHELAHVVQQRQGRVQTTTQGKGMAINDDPALEREADVMGAKAAQGKSAEVGFKTTKSIQKKADPAGHKKHIGALGGDLYLPNGATTKTFSGTTVKGKVTGNTYYVTQGGVSSFTIGEGDDLKTYKAMFSKKAGTFSSYKTSGGHAYQNPAALTSDGIVSTSAWGETQGLYPTSDGNNISGKYQPENWDYAKSNELLRVRAAIHTVATRNSHVRHDSPEAGNIEQTLSVWAMTENFPSTDFEILDDPDVKYFFLSGDPNAMHTGLNYQTNDITMVKSYGPFYNNGGGDVATGSTYILFYKATPKK